VIYVTKFADAIYVLHAFQEKAQKTEKQDIYAAKQALKQLHSGV
jgi:phage-related protein